MGIFLSHLPIELKLNSNQTEVQIIPRYFPYDDNFFGKIYYSADQLYLCLEMEDAHHKYVYHRRYSQNFKKRLHTKFVGIRFWEINNSSLNQTFTVSINDNIKSYLRKKPRGFKFKIRATYRYDRVIDAYIDDDGRVSGHRMTYNKSRTYVFSNELTLEK